LITAKVATPNREGKPLSVVKRCLGAVTLAVAISAGTGVLAATPASATPSRVSEMWHYVDIYRTGAECARAGKLFDTQYNCQYYGGLYDLYAYY
jgi:hypothetical protein